MKTPLFAARGKVTCLGVRKESWERKCEVRMVRAGQGWPNLQTNLTKYSTS